MGDKYTIPLIMDSAQFFQQFTSLITQSKCIAITAHLSPDDDSISSVLGLQWYLQTSFPEVRTDILYTGKSTNRWSYFEHFENVTFVDDIADAIEHYDCLIMVDVSQYSRVSNKPLQEIFKGKKICIDHHKNVPDDFDLIHISPDATSASEVLYRLFYDRCDHIPSRICEIILLGILGDTGTFTYVQPFQSGVFEIAERLVREGNISIQALKGRYMQYSETVFSLIQLFTKRFEIMEMGEWGRFSVTYIDREECSKITTEDSEVSAASHIFIDTYSKAIRGVNWGMVYYPKFYKDEYAASFRSLPQGVNVRLIAQGMGVGGGHDLASGGKFDKASNATSCISQVLAWMRNNAPPR